MGHGCHDCGSPNSCECPKPILCTRSNCKHPMDEHTGSDGCTRFSKHEGYCKCDKFILTRETETVGAPMTVAEARAILMMDEPGRFDRLPPDAKVAWKALIVSADLRIAEYHSDQKIGNCVLCGNPPDKHNFRHVFKGS